jgi:hypothetical protein
MAFPSTLELNYGAEKVVTTQKSRALGTRGVTADGRVFWWSRAGGTALANGVVVCAKAQEGTNQHATALVPSTVLGDWDSTAGAPGIPVGSATIGVVWVTNHSSDEYTDGYMMIDTSPGMGTYRIVADPDKGDSSTATTIRLHPDDTIAQEVLTTVTRLGFHANPHSSVIVAPATASAGALTGVVLGVTQSEVPLDNFFWLQSSGIGHVRFDGLVAGLIGHSVVSGPGTTAGDVIGGPRTTLITTAAITTLSQLTLGSFPVMGYALANTTFADGKFIRVMLTLRS